MSMKSSTSANKRHSKGRSSHGNECTRCVQQATRGSWIPYCEKHQCSISDSRGNPCGVRKKAAEQQCSSHSCSTPACEARRILDSSDTRYTHCSYHTCVEDGCSNQKDQNQGPDAKHNLCKIHSLRLCGASLCHGNKMDGGSHCATHTCKTPECVGMVVNASRPFCVQHNVCGNSECGKERIEVGEEFKRFCQDHSRCSAEQCDFKSSLGSLFCDLHACRYRNCLEKVRPGSGKYYCSEHKCADADCRIVKDQVNVSGGFKSELHKFCQLHRCSIHTCIEKSDPAKGYCDKHCCLEPNCTTEGERNHRCHKHHDEKIKNETKADTEKRLSAEYEAQLLAQAEKMRKEQEKQNALPHREHSPASSNTRDHRREQETENMSSHREHSTASSNNRYRSSRSGNPQQYWEDGETYDQDYPRPSNYRGYDAFSAAGRSRYRA